MPITINGSGTVTGISAGGLPDGTVQPADLSTGAPSWTSGGDITISSLHGTNMIKTGTGDNATRSTYNIAIKGWWGIAFQDYSDTVNRVLDCRDGTFQSLVPGTSSFMREYVCRAWVNFNGTGVVAIRASGNVSSITDNGTGDYTVNFTTAMPDGNYCVTGSTTGVSNGDAAGTFQLYGNISGGAVTKTTTQTRVTYGQSNTGGAQDRAECNFAIFR